MNKSTVVQILVTVLAGVGVASAAPAAVLFTETFSYPDGHLASAPPTGGVSGGVWIVHDAGEVHLPVDVSNGKVTVRQKTHTICIACVTDTGEDVHRDFSVLAAGQTVFAGFDVSASGNDDSVYFAEFMGGPARLFVTPFTGSNFTFGIGYDSAYSVPTVSWPSGLTFGTTYRVVMSYEFDSGSSRLWVNPLNESSSSVQAAGLAFVPVSALALRQHWIGSIAFASSQVLDNLVVGTTFEDVLTVPAPALPGDFNDNDTVDAADYVVWRYGLGTIYTQTDYDVWRAHFGTVSRDIGAGSGAALASTNSLSAAVPEPASFMLAGITFVAGGVFRRRCHFQPTLPGTQP